MAINQEIITFGGGINARRRPFDIEINECSVGLNFDLDPQSFALRPRAPFEFIATAPNGERINGLAQQIGKDGTISTLVQAGAEVFRFDGVNFVKIGDVAPGSRLRGPISQNFTSGNIAIITDLAKLQPVMTWDGNTFAELKHNLSATKFFAKYMRVHNERAIYANIKTDDDDTPHVILGSKIGDPSDLSNEDRPSSAIGLDSPFFIPLPDLKPINGLENAFGKFLLSTRRGRLYLLSGNNAFDFVLEQLHFGSAVAGDEAMINIGNDIILGMDGRIDLLSGVINFGETEADDAGLWIEPLIRDVTGWTVAYDRRRQQVFCFPNNQPDPFVFHKSTFGTAGPNGERLSPWSKFNTASVISSGGDVSGQFGGGVGSAELGTSNPMGFGSTVVMELIHPLTGSTTLWFGDSDGNLFDFAGNNGRDADPIPEITMAFVGGLNEGLTTQVGFGNFIEQSGQSTTFTVSGKLIQNIGQVPSPASGNVSSFDFAPRVVQATATDENQVDTVSQANEYFVIAPSLANGQSLPQLYRTAVGAPGTNIETDTPSNPVISGDAAFIKNLSATQITSDGSAIMIRYSPDGEYLAFVHNDISNNDDPLIYKRTAVEAYDSNAITYGGLGLDGPSNAVAWNYSGDYISYTEPFATDNDVMGAYKRDKAGGTPDTFQVFPEFNATATNIAQSAGRSVAWSNPLGTTTGSGSMATAETQFAAFGHRPHGTVTAAPLQLYKCVLSGSGTATDEEDTVTVLTLQTATGGTSLPDVFPPATVGHGIIEVAFSPDARFLVAMNAKETATQTFGSSGTATDSDANSGQEIQLHVWERTATDDTIWSKVADAFIEQPRGEALINGAMEFSPDGRFFAVAKSSDNSTQTAPAIADRLLIYSHDGNGGFSALGIPADMLAATDKTIVRDISWTKPNDGVLRVR